MAFRFAFFPSPSPSLPAPASVSRRGSPPETETGKVLAIRPLPLLSSPRAFVPDPRTLSLLPVSSKENSNQKEPFVAAVRFSEQRILSARIRRKRQTDRERDREHSHCCWSYVLIMRETTNNVYRGASRKTVDAPWFTRAKSRLSRNPEMERHV